MVASGASFLCFWLFFSIIELDNIAITRKKELEQMDSSIDALFGALKEATRAHLTGGKNGDLSAADELNSNKDILQLDNDTDKTEKVFAEIEKNLQKLPKLNNDFDTLMNEKSVAERVKPTKQQIIDSKAKSDADWFTISKVNDKVRKEVQRDLLLLKHRAALDPKRHYKKDRWQVPDRFSVGTIIEDKTEFYSSRMTNKQRKSTILESMMVDDDTNKYFKRKYTEIQTQKTSGKKGHYTKTKQLRHRK